MIKLVVMIKRKPRMPKGFRASTDAGWVRASAVIQTEEAA